MTERVLFAPGGATEAKQDSVLTALAALLTELGQKYEGGPIALDPATLAALENISAVVSGTVALDGTTLAALEQINATIPHLDETLDSVFAFDTAEEDLVPTPFSVTAVGDTTLATPAAGKRLLLRRVGTTLADPDGSSNPLLKLYVGPTATPANEVLRGYVIGGRVRRLGPVDGPIVLKLSKAGDVSGTLWFEQVAP